MPRFEYIFDAIFYTVITVAAVGVLLGVSFLAADSLGPEFDVQSFEDRHQAACLRANHSQAECDLRLLEAIGR